jgi:hypothetical protein
MTTPPTPAAIFDAAVHAWRPVADARYSPEQVDRVISKHRGHLLRLIEQSLQEQRARRGRGAPRPWWQRTPGLPRADNSALKHEALSILTAVRAYLYDPEWGLLDEEDAAATIHEAIVPHWPLDDAERLIQAVADLEGGLRDEDSFLECLRGGSRWCGPSGRWGRPRGRRRRSGRANVRRGRGGGRAGCSREAPAPASPSPATRSAGKPAPPPPHPTGASSNPPTAQALKPPTPPSPPERSADDLPHPCLLPSSTPRAARRRLRQRRQGQHRPRPAPA